MSDVKPCRTASHAARRQPTSFQLQRWTTACATFSRVTGVAIALWIVVRLESAATQLVLLAMMAGLVHDNLRTSRAMIKHARDAAHGKAQAGTWPL